MPLPTTRCAILLFLLALTGAAIGHAEEPVEVAALVQGQPQEVADLIRRTFTCWHFSGEEPYDEARKQQILAALEQNQCHTLSADEARLREKYRTAPNTIQALDASREWQ